MQINNYTVLISGNYNAFQEGFNAAGAYAISGLIPSSTFKDPLYIGGSEDLKRRIDGEHLPDLNNEL